MKFISKSAQPSSLIQWIAKNKKTSPQNLNYDNFTSDVQKDLRDALLKEQGFICAYTMERLDEDNFHVEHIQPRSLHPSLSYDYMNMVACSNEEAYGAKYRKNDSLPIDFISPLSPFCEKHYQYNQRGNIKSETEAGKATIIFLNLDCKDLNEKRRRAYENHRIVFPQNRKNPRNKFILNNQRSKSEAIRLAEVIVERKHGKFEPYCNAIAHIAQLYGKSI